VLWSKLHFSYIIEAVMRLDYQILLKSPPITLLAGSAHAFSHVLLCTVKNSKWHPIPIATKQNDWACI